MLASMLQRRGNSDELDDEIFKNALSTNYLGMSVIPINNHPPAHSELSWRGNGK